MKDVKSGICIVILHMFCLIPLIWGPIEANAEQNSVAIDNVFLPVSLKPQLSENQKIVHKAQPVKVFIADPNPSTGAKYIPPPAWISAVPDDASSTTFQINFVDNGGEDVFGTECQGFPHAAKVAFIAATNIWAKLINSSAPILIQACWGDFGVDSGTLGYSGGGSYLRDFSGATHENTWYVSSLANALYGRDLLYTEFDMHITFNGDLPGVYHWNYRTDGRVDSDEYDFLTVALHEICHGLGFAGSMDGTSSWGADGYPVIYDIFTRDTFGTRLIDYDDSYSYTLPEALTSGQVFFHGSNAMAANGGERVALFAPSVWMSGSSYSHLSMNFNQPPNELMVYALNRDEAIHDPGPVALGLLKDLGWPDVVDPSDPSDPSDPTDPESADEPILKHLLLLLGKGSS